MQAAREGPLACGRICPYIRKNVLSYGSLAITSARAAGAIRRRTCTFFSLLLPAMATAAPSPDPKPTPEEVWTVIQQESDASHIAWSLEEVVFHSPEPVFAFLQHDPAAYARTLARLIGLVWTTGMSADNIINEARRQLEGQAPSDEFQAGCDALAKRLWGSYR
jgi:hypothetical protein